MKRNFIILFIILSTIITLSINQYKQYYIKKSLKTTTEQFDKIYKTILNDKYEQSSIILTGISKIFKVDKVLYDVLSADESKKNELRKRVYENFKNRYKKLHSLGLRQLHVYLADGKSFLRMHKPNIYGDNLANVRDAIKYVSTTHLPLNTFEVGVYSYGFRAIYPIFYNKEYVGIIELSFAANTITSEIMRHYFVLSNFFLKDTQKTRNNIALDNNVYKPSHHEGYYYDKEVLKEIKIVSGKDMLKLMPSKEITLKIMNAGKGNIPMSVYDEDINSIFTMIPIVNESNNKNVAFLTIRSKADNINSFNQSILIITILSILLVGLVLLVIYSAIAKKDRYQKILDLASDGVYILDLNSKLIECSENVSTMLGYSKKELYTMSLSDIDAVNNLEKFKETFEHLDNYTNTFKTKHKRKDGSIFDVQVNARLVHYNDTRYIYASVRDISEDKRKEEALLLSKKRFEQAELLGNVGSWEYNIETKEFWVSNQSKSIFGLLVADSTSLTAELIENCVPENKRVHQALLNLIEKGSEYNLKYKINPFDGSKSRIVTSIASVKFDEFKNPIKVTGLIQDITEKSILQKEIEDEKNRFFLAIEGSKDGLWDWNIETNELFFSERFEVMLGYDIGDLSKTFDDWFGLLHPDDKEQASKNVQEYLDTKGKGNYENTFRLRMKDSSWKWIFSRGKAQFDEDGKALRFVGFNTDITEQKESQNKLDYIAKHDSLTNLPNRFLLSELLRYSMSTMKRNNKKLALLFIDLDGFKEVNDTLGHEAGDEVLITIASRMKKAVRASDIVARLGGDEFVIVITDLNKKEDVVPLIQQLLSDIALSIKYNENTMNVSASIGVSMYPQITDIGNELLLRQADQAMYSAKTSGKNQYKFFNIESSVL